MKEKSDKSKSTRLSRKFVMIGTELFCLQSEVPRVKSRQSFYQMEKSSIRTSERPKKYVKCTMKYYELKEYC